MQPWPRWWAALALSMFGMGAQAESLRCNGQSVEVGNSRLSLLHKCGEPVLKDSFCAPVYTYPTYQLNPVPLVGPGVPCLPVDEWLYDRGPGNLMATVRLQSGVVRSITYSRQPG